MKQSFQKYIQFQAPKSMSLNQTVSGYANGNQLLQCEHQTKIFLNSLKKGNILLSGRGGKFFLLIKRIIFKKQLSKTDFPFRFCKIWLQNTLWHKNGHLLSCLVLSCFFVFFAIFFPRFDLLFQGKRKGVVLADTLELRFRRAGGAYPCFSKPKHPLY